ncbi:MAG: membrane-bound lytic murein transglycosylase F, partial [Gammaproteobacteria bacterium]
MQGPVQAQSLLNRSYSDLNQASEFHGDFIDILRRGTLRILLPRDFTSATYLPRRRSPLAEQQRIAEEFALSHGLIPELVLVDNFAKLIPALEAGKGDIIINNLTINSQRLKKIAFSVPVDHVYEQVIVRAGDTSIKEVSDLNGKKIMVNQDSTFWHALQWLKANRYPDIEIAGTPDGIAREKLLDYLAEGKIDATIMDDNLASIYASYRDDFKIATNFSSQRDIAWGVRKSAPQLVSEINSYLQLEYQVENRGERFVGDLDEIKKRRLLRVMLPNNAASYFLYRGELQGFEYELTREFADYHGLRLEVVVPSAQHDMSDWLLNGKADIALGFIEPNKKLRTQGVGFSEPYHYTRRHIVVNKSDPAKSWAELAQYTVLVPGPSANEQQLAELKNQGGGLSLGVSETSVDTE